jgi:hypothetical protein
MKYQVTDRNTIRHNKKVYGVGDEIELTDEQAAPLLRSGGIVPLSKSESESQPEPEAGSTEPTDTDNPAVTNSMTREERETQLIEVYDQKGWQGIKAIADKLNISKPAGGWDEAIPLILDAEGFAE